MATINFGNTVSLKQAAQIILSTPENRYLLQGEPGIGKSSILKTLSAALPGHNTAYIDVPNMDLGDIAMPVIDHDTKTTRYYPNARFRIHEGKPVLTMLDEFTKGAEPIKNMLHPLLEVANPRLGDISVHPDSIVFLTGNLSSDGVGDNLKAHTRNRIIPLTVRKPDADEWLEWAINHNIEPVVMAWVKQFPHAMASYTDDGQADNPYIYNPKKVQMAFVSPRSLERASNVVRVRDKLDADSVIAAMTGAVGESAARDMQAFIEYQDQLPSWESIFANPATAAVPDSPGACAVLVYGAITKLDMNSITPFMKYIARFASEWQAAFAINIAKNPTKQRIAFSCKAFADWVQENEDLL
jgi:hypothetical protein